MSKKIQNEYGNEKIQRNNAEWCVKLWPIIGFSSFHLSTCANAHRFKNDDKTNKYGFTCSHTSVNFDAIFYILLLSIIYHHCHWRFGSCTITMVYLFVATLFVYMKKNAKKCRVRVFKPISIKKVLNTN